MESRLRLERTLQAQKKIRAAIRDEETALRQRNLFVWFGLLTLLVGALSLKADASLSPHVTVTKAVLRITDELRWCSIGAVVGFSGLFLGEHAGSSINSSETFKPCSYKFAIIVGILSALLSGFSAGVCFFLDFSFQTELITCSLINSGIFWCLFSFSAYSS